MAYQLKKEHLTNWNAHRSDWDAQNINRKSIINDDNSKHQAEDTFEISANSENRRTPNPNNDKESLQTPLSPTPAPKRPSHTLKYSYNELPQNGIPLAVQYNDAKQQEKNKKKNIRKAPPGQGALVPAPEVEPPSINKNYYPYWRYYKLKNPDWMMRHRQAPDGQLIPYDSFDPSQYVPTPAVTNSATDLVTTPRHQKSHHKSRDNAVTNNNSNKFSYEKSSSKARTTSDDVNTKEYSNSSSALKSSQQPHQSQTTDVSKHGLKTLDHYSTGEITGHHRHHHHHHHHRRHNNNNNIPKSQEQDQQESATKSQQDHHHQYESGFLSNEYVDQEFKVIDASFSKSERSNYFHGKGNPPDSTQPVLYSQDTHLPPIITPRDNMNRSRPTDFYSTITLSKDWRDSIKPPQTYKTDPQTKFYDRYLNSVIEDKIVSQ